MSQTVKNLPAMQETWVQFLGQEDPLEEGMATLSSLLAWRIPRTEEPGGLQSTGLQRVEHKLATEQQLLYNIVLVSAVQQCESARSRCPSLTTEYNVSVLP